MTAVTSALTVPAGLVGGIVQIAGVLAFCSWLRLCRVCIREECPGFLVLSEAYYI